MVLIVLENFLNADKLDRWFNTVRQSQYTKEILFDKIGSSIACNLRIDLFEYIQNLSADFFDRTNTGELMSRVKDDVDRIWEALTFVSMLIIEVCIHTSIILFCM